MNRVSPKKLVSSKWTAVQPVDGERHFQVLRWLDPRAPVPGELEMEAVLTRRRFPVHWTALKDDGCWLPGWHRG